ncbi:MAG: proteasome-activating nucleotidase, partial [Methanomicrobiales archaeon]|nr:proteasome-activating nucleotidase [Methanomicrobiales archaeon]
CTEAGMFAIRAERTTVTQSDFVSAIDKVSADFQRPHHLPPTYGTMFA